MQAQLNCECLLLSECIIDCESVVVDSELQCIRSVFVKHAVNGFLTKQRFLTAFNELFPISNLPSQECITKSRNVLLDMMYHVFDKDRNDLIDLTEFACGLSVLCKGSLEDYLKCKCCSVAV
jgi:Ca2+-binding EF-hand superfamily protein